ncbi:MAG: Gmad2 immunoglobulin-like domain-containing protein [Saprospiraceae bacterium]
MRITFLTLFIIWLGCHAKVQPPVTEAKPVLITGDTVAKTPPPPPDTLVSSASYGNVKFRDVNVIATDDHTFLVRGKAKVFEAVLSWVVVSGTKEIKTGHQMTDAGAPAWGNFSFSIVVPKKKTGDHLTLVLYEASAKDGSRQNQLPILLYEK